MTEGLTKKEIMKKIKKFVNQMECDEFIEVDLLRRVSIRENQKIRFVERVIDDE